MMAQHGVVVDRQLTGGEAGPLQLSGQQVAAGDEHLLVVGVAVEADDVHAVEQRCRASCRATLAVAMNTTSRQVEVELEVVVAERVVLRRVEHLEQRRRRVAATSRRR